MNGKKPLEDLVNRVFPLIAIIVYMITFAVIFDTFNLALEVAFYNILLSLPLFGFFLMIFRRFHIAPIVTASAAFILFYIDQYVFASRLTHIRFSDFNLISQAARVANRYSLVWNADITKRLLVAIVLCSFLIFIYRYYKLSYSLKPAFFMGAGIFVVSTAIILFGIIPSGEREDFNFTTNTEQRGLLYSWYCQANNAKVEEPEGYSKSAAEEILRDYEITEGMNDVRIIVIMNESLADYSLLGTTRFEDTLPFIHSLVDSGDAFEGKLAASVYAGGTANTEFEFLTGNSTAFLPEDSTPYLQYVNHSMNSIVEDIGEVSKIAIHPYYSEEWNRTQVYRFFGFDRFISGVDFGSEVDVNGKSATSRPSENIVSFGEGPLYVRGLISDKTCFERIASERADFTFAVTMQNHGAYDYSGDDFINTEYVIEDNRAEWNGNRNLNGMLYNIEFQDVKDELYKVNQYLTLSNLSDQAFEELIEALKNDEQKTIVLMFGDHQPGVMIPEHYVDCEESVDMDYVVPYIFWANYDIDFDAPEYTSPNYLSVILKKNAGMALTAWDQFRFEMMEEYPVITANFILDKNGNKVSKDELKDYEIVQYMRMFD